MIEVIRSEGLCIITINRPEKANSLTKKMLEELFRAFDDAETSGAVILTGRGKVFSAGADLTEARAGLATDDIWERLSHRIATLPGLTIAALNGTLAGGAMGMALACDLRLSVPEANFFYPVVNLGFLPQPSDPARLAALVGPAKAKLILLTGLKASAEDALSWGLIDRIVHSDQLMEHAKALVTPALGAKHGLVADIKRLIKAD